MNTIQTISLLTILGSITGVSLALMYFFVTRAKQKNMEIEEQGNNDFQWNEFLAADFLRCYRLQKPRYCKELNSYSFKGLSINEKLELFKSSISRSRCSYRIKGKSNDFIMNDYLVVQYVKAVCSHKNNFNLKNEDFNGLDEIEKVLYFNEACIFSDK